MLNDKNIDRFFRASVGYDPLFTLMTAPSPETGYPPYNIEKTGEASYEITLALAGLQASDIALQVHQGVLTVDHAGDDTAAEDRQYLYRGIAMRPFRRQFRLAENVVVSDARLEHGLLTISLQRIVPEDQKPRSIPIRATAGRADLGGF